MFSCEACGKEVGFPFVCDYCNGSFCADHQLPENHNCPKMPTRPPSYVLFPSLSNERSRKLGACPRCHRADSGIIKYNAEKAIFRCWNCGLVYGQKKGFPYHYFRVHKRKPVIEPQNEQRQGPITYKTNGKKSSKKKALIAIMLAVILIASVFLVVAINSLLPNGLFSNSNYSTPTPFLNSSHSTSFMLTTPAPTIISFPTTMPTNSPSATSNDENPQDLVNYALSLINADRQSNNLQNVSLSSINSGQIHADEMLKNGYSRNFSHWDMNGYKPYMRYTLAGGKGAVSENVAWEGLTGNIFSIDVKKTIKELEWMMMYDDASSNWGHKDNILTPLHNKVSIGIAYDFNNVYFVEDFEDDYISWSQLTYNSRAVTMQGTTHTQGNIQQIAIFYDNPSPLSLDQLGQAPYNGSYDPGTYVGLVLPQNYQAQNGITITADNWNQNGYNFQISFQFDKALASHFTGVYTLYVEIGSSTGDSLTTYSLFIR